MSELAIEAPLLVLHFGPSDLLIAWVPGVPKSFIQTIKILHPCIEGLLPGQGTGFELPNLLIVMGAS